MLAWDCNYDPKISLVESYHSYQIIFRGNVKSIKKTTVNKEIYSEITFNILESYKGSENHKVTFFQNNTDSDIFFMLGQEWIIWANQLGKYFYTSQCTPSKLIQNITDFEKTMIKDISNTEGYKIWYDQKGDKVAEGTLNNNVAVGVWKYYYYGILNSTGVYDKGLKDGKWTSFWEIFFYQGNFSEQKNEFVKEILNTEKSNFRRIKSIANYKQGQYDGDFFRFDFSGRIQSLWSYKNNKRDGVGITYEMNGKPTKIYNYKNDKLNGTHLSFFNSGKLELICNYIDDKRAEDWTLFDEDGIVLCSSKLSGKFPLHKNDKYYCDEN